MGEAKKKKIGDMDDLFCFFLFSFIFSFLALWYKKLLGQGSDLSRSCDLSHNCKDFVVIRLLVFGCGFVCVLQRISACSKEAVCMNSQIVKFLRFYTNFISPCEAAGRSVSLVVRFCFCFCFLLFAF